MHGVIEPVTRVVERLAQRGRLLHTGRRVVQRGIIEFVGDAGDLRLQHRYPELGVGQRLLRRPLRFPHIVRRRRGGFHAMLATDLTALPLRLVVRLLLGLVGPFALPLQFALPVTHPRVLLRLALRRFTRVLLGLELVLGPQRLPFHEAAGKDDQLLIFYFPHLRGETAQHGTIVAHDQTATLVLFDRVLECFDAFHVEVIRGLVENEQVVGGQREQRQRHAGALTPRQRTNRALHFVAAVAEATKVTLHLTTLPERTLGGDGFVNRGVERKMSEILTVVRHRGTRSHLYAAGMHRMLLHERLDQRALAGAIRADQRDHFVALEYHVHVAQQFTRAVRCFHRHGHVLGLDDAIATATASRQAQRHHAVAADRRRQARHTRQQLATSLGLLGVLAGQIARDVIALRSDLGLLLVELTLLREPSFFTLNEERLVTAVVGDGGAALEVQYMIGHDGEKGAIVADTDHGPIGLAQILLEPRRRFEIEVIRGLVEQQDFGGRGELSGQRDTSAFTATQRADVRGLRRLGVEADAHEHGVDLGGHLIATVTIEAFEIPAVLFHRLFAMIVLEIGGLFGQRLLEGTQITEGIGHDLPERHAVGKSSMLVHQCHAEPGHARHGPAGRHEVAGDQANERGLAGTVAADHGPAVARADGERDVTKDLGRAEIHPRVTDGKKSHACACRRSAKTVIRESNRTSTLGEAHWQRARFRPAVRPANAARATPARDRAIRHARPPPHRRPWVAG